MMHIHMRLMVFSFLKYHTCFCTMLSTHFFFLLLCSSVYDHKALQIICFNEMRQQQCKQSIKTVFNQMQKNAVACMQQMLNIWMYFQDVVLLVYAGWCGFCMALSHTFLHLAHYFRNSPEILFARYLIASLYFVENAL